VGASFKYFASNETAFPLLLNNGEHKANKLFSKACNQKEEFGSLFCDVSSCILQQPQSTGADNSEFVTVMV
jgi:hypothetical protein